MGGAHAGSSTVSIHILFIKYLLDGNKNVKITVCMVSCLLKFCSN